MGSSRKRRNDYHQHSPASLVTPFHHFLFLKKKHRLPASMDQRATRITRYPDSKPGIRREVHGPVRSNRFAFSHRIDKGLTSAGFDESSSDKMKILSGRYESTKNLAMESLRYITEDVAAVSLRLGIEIDGNEENQTVVSDDSGVEEVKMAKKKPQSTVLSNEKVDLVEEMMNSMQLDEEPAHIVVPAHKKLYDSSHRRHNRFHILAAEKELADVATVIATLQGPRGSNEGVGFHLTFLLLCFFELLCVSTRLFHLLDVAEECFLPLNDEEVVDITSAFSSKSNRGKVLVSHEHSNIDITGEKLQCLKPGGWLNDEVINLYVELLKEREKREPQKFLKCHFFNTFFYKKLFNGKGGYNFQSVRRWTTLKKLGYSLLDCDKIFVPVHKTNHWCLAVINKTDEKFQYLDSLKAVDNKVLKVLARYYVDEVKDKSGEDIDVSSWEEEFVKDLPGQENGYDCGMFMVKYVDFYSRDIGLCFSQKDMPYFRQRTAKEILRLRAD